MHSILILGNLTDSLPAITFSCPTCGSGEQSDRDFVEKAGQNIDLAATGRAKEV